MLNKIKCFSKIGKLGKFSSKRSNECPYEKNKTNPIEIINPDFILFFNSWLIKIQINTVDPNVSKTGKIISLGDVLTFCEYKKIIGNIARIRGWITVNFLNCNRSYTLFWYNNDIHHNKNMVKFYSKE